MEHKPKARVIRQFDGTHLIFCQRAPRKWWFELGKHEATDRAFEQGLRRESSFGIPKFGTKANFFQKIKEIVLLIKKITLYLQ